LELVLIQKTGIGIEMKKYELELFHKTRIGIGIDSKTRTGIDSKNRNWN
jgi:hypothetical protein